MGIEDASRQNLIVQRLGQWSVLHQFERGQISAETFFRHFRSEFGFTEHSKLEHAWNLVVDGVLEGIEEVFSLLENNQVPVYALSNTNFSHLSYIQENFPIIKEFTDVMTSFELGFRKPELEIFQAAAKQVQLEPAQIIFVDDSFKNVAAARSVGLKAYQTIDSPSETLKVIRETLDI